MLLFAAGAFYLAIGSALLGVEEILQPERYGSIKYQVLQFGVLVAAAVGGSAMLERTGAERLLKWTLMILAASCALVLASPLLRDIGVVPETRFSYRMTSTITDPNEVGLIACMTVVLALAFQSNGRRRPLGYLALVLGYAATLASFSRTAAISMGVVLTLFLLQNIRRLKRDLLHTGLTVLYLAGVLIWLIPGTPVVNILNIREAWVVDQYKAKRVGDTIAVFLFDGKSRRDYNNPVNPWRWQRADARPGDVNTPDDATWTNIEGTLSPNYTPADEDRGKFLRAWVSYEKNGTTYRVQTAAIGPIMAASATTAADATAPVHLLKEAGETVELIRSLSRRIVLWEIGFNKALESPIVGHGLYQLHRMEGTPLGYHGEPVGVHNVYLMLLAEAGVIPLALYLLVLFFLMRLLWTVPRSLGRDMVVGWVILIALYGLPHHYLFPLTTFSFTMGLACATAGFLVQRQRDQTAA